MSPSSEPTEPAMGEKYRFAPRYQAKRSGREMGSRSRVACSRAAWGCCRTFFVFHGKGDVRHSGGSDSFQKGTHILPADAPVGADEDAGERIGLDGSLQDRHDLFGLVELEIIDLERALAVG